MVWSESVDAWSNKGLQKIIEATGLDWTKARDVLGNDDWRMKAEANRAEMMSYGIGGSPVSVPAKSSHGARTVSG